MKEYTKPTCEMVRCKPIDGYENYFITETGLVWSVKSKKFLKPLHAGGSYFDIHLWKDGVRTSKLIHVLVAEAFVPKPQTDEPIEVHHISGNPTNNCASNLMWLTKSEHQAIHGKRPIKCIENDKTYASQHDAARDLGLSVGNINECLHGKRRQTCGYHFKFVEE